MDEKLLKRIYPLAMKNAVVYAMLVRYQMGQVDREEFLFRTIEELVKGNEALREALYECVSGDGHAYTA